MKLSPHEIAYVAEKVGFDSTTDQVEMAVAVALAESGGDTDIMGRSITGANIGNRDHGLWQISGRWHYDKLQGMGDWRDPYENGRMAFKIFIDAGKVWTPWHVFTGGSYLTYLPDAVIGAAHPFAPYAYSVVRAHVAR